MGVAVGDVVLLVGVVEGLSYAGQGQGQSKARARTGQGAGRARDHGEAGDLGAGCVGVARS